MTLYTKDGSYPAELPDRIRLSDGTTKTDSSTFTADEIADAGYIAVADKPTPTQFQDVVWSGSDWVVADWGDDRIAYYWREVRDTLLSDTDVYGLSDVPMSPEIQTYRQELRDVPQQAGFPHTITWPTHPDDIE